MNIYQQIILLLFSCVLVAMLLFPPFYFQYGTGAVDNLGYHFIFAPPRVGSGFSAPAGSVQVSTLLMQILVASLLAGVAYVLASGSSKSDRGQFPEASGTDVKHSINYVRIIKRVVTTVVAFTIAAVIVAVLRVAYPSSIEAAIIRAVIPIAVIIGVWRWTAKFK